MKYVKKKKKYYFKDSLKNQKFRRSLHEVEKFCLKILYFKQKKVMWRNKTREKIYESIARISNIMTFAWEPCRQKINFWI